MQTFPYNFYSVLYCINEFFDIPDTDLYSFIEHVVPDDKLVDIIQPPAESAGNAQYLADKSFFSYGVHKRFY